MFWPFEKWLWEGHVPEESFSSTMFQSIQLVLEGCLLTLHLTLLSLHSCGVSSPRIHCLYSNFCPLRCMYLLLASFYSCGSNLSSISLFLSRLAILLIIRLVSYCWWFSPIVSLSCIGSQSLSMFLHCPHLFQGILMYCP